MTTGEQETKTHDLTDFRAAVKTVAERGITPGELADARISLAKSKARSVEQPTTEKRQ